MHQAQREMAPVNVTDLHGIQRPRSGSTHCNQETVEKPRQFPHSLVLDLLPTANGVSFANIRSCSPVSQAGPTDGLSALLSLPPRIRLIHPTRPDLHLHLLRIYRLAHRKMLFNLLHLRLSAIVLSHLF